jgi:NAD(P)-dependent dehydrogenase (short-subunit alcohol dehydrogenase family)
MAQSVVVVTGALTGIGEATAKVFAERGDFVVISGRHDNLGAQLAQDLKAAGSDVRRCQHIAHRSSHHRNRRDQQSRQVGTAVGVGVLVALTAGVAPSIGYPRAWTMQAVTAILAALVLLGGAVTAHCPAL